MKKKDDKLIWRIIDVNLNRSREGLRIIEEFARFGLEDSSLSKEIKNIRHEIKKGTQKLLKEKHRPGRAGVFLYCVAVLARIV